MNKKFIVSRFILAPLLGITLLGALCIGREAQAQGVLTWTATHSTTWDTSTANWSGSTYSDGDSVLFGDPVPSGGTVTVTGGGVNPSEVQVLNNSGIYTIAGGAIEGSGELLKENNGTLVLGSSNSYSGGTVISGGEVTVEDGDSSLGNSTGGLTLDGGTLSVQNTALVSSRNLTVTSNNGTIDTGGFNSSTSGSVSGTGTLTKAGAGDFTLNGAIGSSSQNVGLSVAQGSLTIGEQGSQFVTTSTTPGNFAGDLNLEAGVALEVASNPASMSPVLINGGGTVHILGSGASIIADGGLEIDNNIALNSQSLSGQFSMNFDEQITGQLTISGTISGSSDVNFVSAGRFNSPLFLLNAPATYTGVTNLEFTTGAVLRLGINNALPAGTQLSFAQNSGALDLSGYNQTISSLSDQGNDNGITNTAAVTSTLTVNQNTDTTFLSTIGTPSFGSANLNPLGPDLDNINVIKSGSGALRLTGNETYSGSTAVTGGTLIVNGGISGSLGGITNTSGVSVTSGATLAGGGLVAVAPGGQVLIGTGATISPGDNMSGDSPTGLLTISDPSGTPASGGTFDLESGGNLFISLQAFETGGSQDPGNNGAVADSQLAVAGNITLSGSLTGTLLSGFTANPGDLFFIILNQGTNPVQGTFAGNPSTVTFIGGGQTVTFDVGYNGNSTNNTFIGGNDVVLMVAIPEPGGSALCLVSLSFLVICRHRRRRC